MFFRGIVNNNCSIVRRSYNNFYEDAIAATQDFSQTFLHTLTRFDAIICLITDSSHPIIPTFSTQHPHPIQSILTWLQRTLLQN
ncbi:NACHT C-terminal alpha/beta 1 domain-containing protein [Microcoleus sp. MON1_C5]|uniref:NACHT C-terminal alpha/beta 1 domain-containing protein n=1 Tax=Microcoleus sp. MON1_C5 TaxID=2818828 RepID=UPI00403F322B